MQLRPDFEEANVGGRAEHLFQGATSQQGEAESHSKCGAGVRRVMPLRDHHTQCQRHTVAWKKHQRGEGTSAALRETPIQRIMVDRHGKSQTHVSLVTVIIVLERACFSTPHALCIGPPREPNGISIYQDHCKENKDASQQRREQITVTTGFFSQQIKAMTCDRCSKKGLH